ncbi:MAG: ABC transporter ATP-binding protein [Acetanaerobacterium sp.]
MSVITLNNLTKTYGKSRGIQDVNLTVEKGEFYGFIGPNGAGKSTTIKLLFNFIFPTGGGASVLGLDCVHDSKKIKQTTAYVPSEVRFYPQMTSRELFLATLAFHQKKDPQQLEEMCALFEIEQNKRIGELSLGNRKKVAIVCALICEPELMILDEPANGLDPLMQRTLFEVLKKRNAQGLTVFLSSHNLTEVQEHCSKAAFIKEGRIIEVQDFTQQTTKEKIVTVWGAQHIGALTAAGAVILKEDNNRCVLSYCGDDLSQLANAVAQSAALDFTVENPSLESRFLSYYKGGSAQ